MIRKVEKFDQQIIQPSVPEVQRPEMSLSRRQEVSRQIVEKNVQEIAESTNFKAPSLGQPALESRMKLARLRKSRCVDRCYVDVGSEKER